jgi:BirA family biotin operon repressor/biotin-[acetyl-CoA-carboxylase] ligase
MAFALSERARTAGYRVLSFDEVGSTNEEALSRARAGEGGPLWVAALRQTAGRGRRGSGWQTARGNLAATLLLRAGYTPAQAATLGFVAGLAAHEALRICAPETRTELKWPNDILANGGKLCGILLESEKSNEGSAIVIGIGINVESAPSDLPYPAASLAALGSDVRPEQLFEALADSWIGYFEMWDDGRGMAQIRSHWLERAAGIGGAVTARMGLQSVSGIFETLDENGRLMLRRADNSLMPVSAGEVYFGDAARNAARVQ